MLWLELAAVHLRAMSVLCFLCGLEQCQQLAAALKGLLSGAATELFLVPDCLILHMFTYCMHMACRFNRSGPCDGTP